MLFACLDRKTSRDKTGNYYSRMFKFLSDFRLFEIFSQKTLTLCRWPDSHCADFTSEFGDLRIYCKRFRFQIALNLWNHPNSPHSRRKWIRICSRKKRTWLTSAFWEGSILFDNVPAGFWIFLNTNTGNHKTKLQTQCKGHRHIRETYITVQFTAWKTQVGTAQQYFLIKFRALLESIKDKLSLLYDYYITWLHRILQFQEQHSSILSDLHHIWVNVSMWITKIYMRIFPSFNLIFQKIHLVCSVNFEQWTPEIHIPIVCFVFSRKIHIPSVCFASLQCGFLDRVSFGCFWLLANVPS